MPSSGSPSDIYDETLAVFDQRDDPTEPLTTPEVADSLGAARRTVYKRLEKLEGRGELKTKKVGARARVWWRPAEGPAHGGHADESTPRRSAPESTVEEVLERVTDGFYGLDEQFRFTYVNSRAEDLLDLAEPTVRGQRIDDELSLTAEFEAALHEAYETQEPVFFEDFYEPLDAWFENAIYPTETGLSVYFRDTSDRKRLEHDLRIQKEHLRSALANSPLVVFRLDTDLRYTWVANPHEDFDPGDLLGKRDDDLLPPEAAAKSMEPKRRALETGERVREEVTLELSSGLVAYDLTVSPLRDETGEIVGLTAASFDLTEQKKAERALQESEERLRLALEAGELGVWELDLQSETSPVRSPRHDRIFGYDDLEDWSFEQFVGHVHPEDRDRVRRSFEEAAETGELRFECRIVRADDAQRWIETRGEYYEDDDGEPTRAVGVVRDVTERNETRDALYKSRERLEAFVRATSEAVYRMNPDWTEMRYLDGRGFISDTDEPQKNWLEEYVPADKRERVQAAIEEAIETQSPFELEHQVVQADGSRGWTYSKAVPILDENGDIAEWFGTATDITERKKRERDLEEYRRQYRTLIDNFPSGTVALVDRDMQYVVFGGTTGVPNATAADFEGEPVRDVLPQRIADVVVPRYEAALDGEAAEFEERIGETVYHFNFIPVRDDQGDVFAVTALSRDVTRRVEREEELAALDRLNRIARDVTHLVLESPTREEVEQKVCETVTESDAYEYAWVGHLDRQGRALEFRPGDSDATRAPVTIPVTGEVPSNARAIADAVRTHELQVTRDAGTDPVFAEWAGENSVPGVRAVVPLVYEDRVYGVLNVYTTREYAFEDTERRILGQIGTVVGHALTSIDRKQALLEDRVTELTFRSETVGAAFTGAVSDDSPRISLERSIPVADGQTISYYSVHGIDPEAFVDAVEGFSGRVESRILEQTGSLSRVEIRTAEETLAARLAKYNGWVVESNLEDGAFWITVQVPRGSNVREIQEHVTAAYPDAEFVSQTEVSRENPRLTDVVSELDDELTERQRTALKVAFYAGYFDWPRGITGEELAERLDVTPATAHYHLRHGERKLVAAFFDTVEHSAA